MPRFLLLKRALPLFLVGVVFLSFSAADSGSAAETAPERKISDQQELHKGVSPHY
jgi:hypothetical protein